MPTLRSAVAKAADGQDNELTGNKAGSASEAVTLAADDVLKQGGRPRTHGEAGAAKKKIWAVLKKENVLKHPTGIFITIISIALAVLFASGGGGTRLSPPCRLDPVVVPELVPSSWGFDREQIIRDLQKDKPRDSKKCDTFMYICQDRDKCNLFADKVRSGLSATCHINLRADTGMTAAEFSKQIGDFLYETPSGFVIIEGIENISMELTHVLIFVLDRTSHGGNGNIERDGRSISTAQAKFFAFAHMPSIDVQQFEGAKQAKPLREKFAKDLGPELSKRQMTDGDVQSFFKRFDHYVPTI